MNQPNGEEILLVEALRLPPEQRSAYLDRVTNGNPALRQRVESLLESYQAGDFLEHAPATALGPEFRVWIPVPEKPGDNIGRYKILQRIGEGGCGTVYMAEQEEPVRRRVAVKIIKLGMDTKSVIARFEAERQALAMMDNPNIAKVFDAGTTETGRPYFVMELVRGVRITDYCDDQNLPTRQRLDLFMQVCQAIQHAHQKGVIHRDIKPSNILVTINDGVAVPKVIDFGIAKATGGQRLTDKTLVTAFEQFIGTPAYMSPEQALMTSLDIDTRSDIYGLGVLLYELLTGQTPFDSRELLAIGLDEMRRTIREKEPERPSTRLSTLPEKERSTTAQHRGLNAPSLVSQLGGDLDWIVMKCLEKDRARRYETANGLAMDLQRHLNSEPVLARPPSATYRFRKLVRRNKLAVAATGAVILSLAIGLALSTMLFLKEKRARARADEQAAIARAVKDFLQNDLLGQADPFDQADSGFEPKSDLTVDEALERASSRIGQRFTNEPLVEADVRQTLGATFYALGRHDSAITNFELAISLYNRVLGPEDPNTLTMSVTLGDAYEQANRPGDAAQLWNRTWEIQKAKLGSGHPDTLRTATQVARTIWWAGRLNEAVSLLEQTLVEERHKLGADHSDTLTCMYWLGLGYGETGRWAEAISLYEELLRRTRARFGVQHPATVAAMMRLAGNGYIPAGRPNDAIGVLEEASRLCITPFGPASVGHPSRITILFALAKAYGDAGRQAEKERILKDILARAIETQPGTVEQLRFRGGVFAELGRWKEAAADLDKVFELNHGDWIRLAAMLVQSEEVDRYRELRQKLLARFGQEIQKPANVSAGPGPACLLARACLVVPCSGAELDSVIALAERAVVLQRSGNGTNDSFWPWCSTMKAKTEYLQGRFTSAVQWAQETLDASSRIERGVPDWLRVESYAILAMGLHQLKQSDLALSALSTARQIARAKLPILGELRERAIWPDNIADAILADQLIREATALIEGHPTTKLERDEGR